MTTATAVRETLGRRFRLERSSHGRQTLPKRVSDDSQRFIFRRQKIFVREKFRIENFVFRQFGVVLEEPRPNGPQNQLARQILL